MKDEVKHTSDRADPPVPQKMVLIGEGSAMFTKGIIIDQGAIHPATSVLLRHLAAVEATVEAAV